MELIAIILVVLILFLPLIGLPLMLSFVARSISDVKQNK